MPEFDSTIEYRDIPGWPGYKACTDGSIWSCRRVTRIKGKPGCVGIVGVKWRKLSPGAHSDGHLFVKLCPGAKTAFVHKLVLEAFVGPRPKGMQCCHFPDRNPSNNWLDNLRWGTASENCQDAAKHGTITRGEIQGLSKLTTEAVLEIRRDYKGKNGDLTRLAAKYQVTKQSIYAVVRRKTWKHI